MSGSKVYYVILVFYFSAVAPGTSVLVGFNTSKGVTAVAGEIICLSVLPHQASWSNNMGGSMPYTPSLKKVTTWISQLNDLENERVSFYNSHSNCIFLTDPVTHITKVGLVCRGILANVDSFYLFMLSPWSSKRLKTLGNYIVGRSYTPESSTVA